MILFSTEIKNEAVTSKAPAQGNSTAIIDDLETDAIIVLQEVSHENSMWYTKETAFGLDNISPLTLVKGTSRLFDWLWYYSWLDMVSDNWSTIRHW